MMEYRSMDSKSEQFLREAFSTDPENAGWIHGAPLILRSKH